MPYDATNAFRCYRLTTVPRRLFDVVVSRGYSFFFESLYVLHRNGFRIAEIPIPLPNRTYGSSKMSLREIRRQRASCSWRPASRRSSTPRSSTSATTWRRAGTGEPGLRDEQGWDDYWDGQRTRAGGLLYDAIAVLLPEVDHPAVPQPIRAPLLRAGRAACSTRAAAAARWTPTSATTSPSPGSTSP